MQHSTFVSSRDHRSIALLMVLGGVGVAGLAVDPAEAALMTYTLDGGTATITGSVGGIAGVSFTNASWTLTATADSSQAQSGTVTGGTPARLIPTTVTLWIGGTSSPVATVTMSDYSSGGNNFSWQVFSVDFGSGAGAAGFGPGDLSATPDWAIEPGADVRSGGTPGIYNDLSVSGVWTGASAFWIATQDYQTSGGLLELTTVVNGSGTWTIANASAVPGGGGAVLLAAGLVRRRRRR